jgi:riboflavin kinase/FMN adenylyltransferase
MLIFNDFINKLAPKKIGAITIGVFDGVHKGHKSLIDKVIHSSHQEKSALITFSNHPKSFFDKEKKNILISTLEHKIELLKSTGIDCLFVVPFTKEFAEITAKKFLEAIKDNLNPSKIILGYDAVIGRNREGTKEFVEKLTPMLGIDVEYIKPVFENNQIISSTKIRDFIRLAKFDEASLQLGRPYSIYGKVQNGNKKATLLGFPTANINVNMLQLPPFGVYKVSIKFKGQLFKAVANLGIRPTFNQEHNDPLLEVHIFDFDENLYEEYIEVIFIEFIRNEKRFNSIDELIAQIKEDIKACQ